MWSGGDHTSSWETYLDRTCNAVNINAHSCNLDIQVSEARVMSWTAALFLSMIHTCGHILRSIYYQNLSVSSMQHMHKFMHGKVLVHTDRRRQMQINLVKLCLHIIGSCQGRVLYMMLLVGSWRLCGTTLQ